MSNKVDIMSSNGQCIKCWLFDVDGTLMDGRSRIHYLFESPKNWDAYFGKVRSDAPIEHMFRIGRALAAYGDPLVCVTGRPERLREDTLWQLAEHRFPPISGLYMREDGDRRDDDIIKVELLGQIRSDGFDPIAVFDDRDRVVRAWRAAGLPCLQVAPGDF